MPVDYSGSNLNQLAAQAANPAAPTGLSQTATAAAGVVGKDDKYADSTLGKLAAEQGFVDTSSSWYTGANAAGENNGWATEFQQKFQDGYDRAAADGTLATYFEQPDATGVVTYDQQSSDGRHTFHFGDVYVDGKRVANLYDQQGGGFDKDTANLMMSQYLFDGTQLGRIFADSDRMGALDRAVQEKRGTNNEELAKAAGAAEFNDKVQTRAEDWTEGNADDLVVGGAVLGGAATGAGTGALIGSVVPVAGTAAGAAVGGAIGAAAGLVGGLLNKDELTQQAARAYEITKLAGREEGDLAQAATFLQQWGGFSQQLTSPITNIEHGVVDTLGENKLGDAKSGYYAQDDKGGYTRPIWAKPLSLASTVGDSLMQFASPLNRAIYTTQMSAVIGGESAMLATTGKAFDPREGGFDNIFLNDDGGFDPVSAAAGILKVGIDAVQVAGLRGIARQASSAKAAVSGGGAVTEAAGSRFVLDETGRAISRTRTFALLAPSEQVAAASAARRARVAAQLEGRAVTADDYYRAATSLAAGGSAKLKAALINGFGEGYEEVAQGILEPVSMDGKVRPSDLLDAFQQGAAAGFGMGLGATAGGPTSDERLKAQAYVLATFRNEGVEPDWEEFNAAWEGSTPAQRRAQASRSRADIEVTRQALEKLAGNQATDFIASGVDAAKAIDAKRSVAERELQRASSKTDAFHVIGGLLDADPSRPAEAVEADAVTVAQLLLDRYRGLELQDATLADRVAALQQAVAADAEDTAAAERLAEAEQLRKTNALARAVGANVIGDVDALLERIYTGDQAAAVEHIDALNKLLESLYFRRAEVVAPEGVTATPAELADAAAQFVTLLHAREPKLDSGSYVALLPRASQVLTLDRAGNLLQVNTDILSAINGDFDGDKLRSEYQLVLTPERYVQARAGQNLAGRGAGIDVAVRNFDKALAEAIGTALTEPNHGLRTEAEAVLARIQDAVLARYPELSPAAAEAVFTEFRTAVRAGSESARTTLLDALAREAGELVTNRGRAQLSNEWLWVSQVVRAEFQGFQRSYRTLRAAGSAPTAEVAPGAVDTPEQTNRRKKQAVNDAQTLALFAVGNTLFRKFQKIHYSWYNSPTVEAANAELSDLYDAAALYEELSRGVTRPEIATAGATDSIAGRVLVMLDRLVDAALGDPELRGSFSATTARSVLANVKVKDVQRVNGEPVLVDNSNLTLLQVLLRRALDADREEHRLTFEADTKLQAKHARLRAMTISNDVAEEVNAERAFIEVFGSVPFAESLGGVVGNLAPHTTPEQWLRNYLSLDTADRKQHEVFFTSVPEYLDRKERSNMPYSLKEAERGEVSAYRSMMDAMLAVGRSELTFNPDAKEPRKAFGGRRAEAAHRAMDDFVETHKLLGQALAEYRKTTNRSRGKRKDDAALVQEMFEANPREGLAILEAIPEAAANAIYEWREGRLYTARWVYQMFAMKDPKEALAFYWTNLALAQWNSTQVAVHEDDSDAPGRAYRKLNSRFQRLLYQLAKESPEHLELLVRKMSTAKDLDALFLWINTAPGIRGEQAVLLPFYDDVADFEADSAGAWSTSSASSDLRTALSTAKVAAQRLRDTVSFREAVAATDHTILAGIKAAQAGDPAATPTDHENLRKLAKVVATSTQLPRGFAPSAMLALTQGVVRGFDPHSTDKGMSPDSYRPLGEFQALMDAFAFVPGLERVMETLTAHSLSSLRTNVGDLAKHGGTAMDSTGRPIQWQPMSVEQAIEMLSDPRTAPLGHALLTPQLLDVANGKLVDRLLVEPSLKALLDEEHYKELFRLDGDGALNRATRYLSLLDARARAEGGHFDVLRYVNAATTTRLAALDHPATEADIERVKAEAYLDTARMLQELGAALASPDIRDAGVIEELRDQGLKLLRAENQARRLPGFTDDTGRVVESWVEGILVDLENQKDDRREELIADLSGEELTRQLAILEAQYATNAERVRAVLADDLVGMVAARFHLTGDPAADQAKRVQIAEFARSMASFPTRAPESAALWSKLVGQMADGRMPGDEFDWEQLSRSVMGVYLADQVIRVAGHVSLPPFFKPNPAKGEGPEESQARFYKYFDPGFGYLVTDLIAKDTPIAAAAQWMHQLAGQPSGLVSLDSLTSTMKRTVLNTQKLGAWTPGLLSQLVETEQRMDSAAAGQAIAAAGNGPKRWAAIAFATRRTARTVPGAELASTVTLTGDLLAEDASPFNELEVTLAGATAPTAMPVAQLDNRFYTGIKVNGEELALDEANLGFAWAGEQSETGYRYIALDRLRRVVQRRAKALGVPLSQLSVELSFFHPDSKPAGEPHNLYFDGMGHSLLPDGSESLIATLWSDNEGMISVDTQRPLDAGKKGLRAIQQFSRLDPARVAEANELWSVHRDLAAMLRRKTELTLTYDDGSGALEASDYNAVYKMLGLQHIVVGERDGKPAAMTADEVIAFQAANGREAELPLANARLVTLSPDVLRTMLGETGNQGVAGFFDEEYLLNPDLVAEYTGITEGMLRKFGEGWTAEPGTLADTALANVGSQRALTVRTVLTAAERNARAERIQFQAARAAQVVAERARRLKKGKVRQEFLDVISVAMASTRTETNTFNFLADGLPIAPRDIHDAPHTQRLLEQYRAHTDGQQYNRGWRVQDGGTPYYPGGVLTVESLDEGRELEHQVVRGDFVLLELDTFTARGRDVTQVNDRLEKALRYLVNTGADIVLGPGDGSGDLRYDASQWLVAHGYAPVRNSRHLYTPVEHSFQSQNEKAYESTLTEKQRITPARNVVTFLTTDPLHFDENGAALNPRSRKLSDAKLLKNLLPDAYVHYNIPVEGGRGDGLYAQALDHLRTVTDPTNAEARAELVAMAGADLRGVKPIAQALDDFHAKITNSASLAPEVGDTIEPGDIIPFVHLDGRVVLYRHGLKLPRAHQLRGLQDRGGLNVALATSETEPAATANAGVIVNVENRPGYARSLALKVALQPLGNKIQLEENGMKYILVPPTREVDRFLAQPVFGNGTYADLISDLASADSKEAYAGRVNGYRNALAFFQFDFTDDLTRFFFDGAVTAENRVLTYSMLERLSRATEFEIPTASAAELATAGPAIADLLSSFASAEVERGKVPAEWTDRLASDDTAEAAIARAVITYLLTPGAEVDDVLKSSGFSHPEAANEVVTTLKVPGLFASLLDNGADHPLHAELIRRFDAQLTGWRLHPDWTVEVFAGGDSLRGYLQFGEAHSSGDNPVLDAQAYDPNGPQAVSAHNAMAAALSMGAITAHEALKKTKAFARSFTRGGGVSKFGADGDSFWSMLTALPDEKSTELVGWRRENPAETARRAAARGELVGFYTPLNTENWPEGQLRQEYEREVTGVLEELNLYGSQVALVETWIRQQLGRPHAVVDGVERGVISLEDALEMAKLIRKNIRLGLLPTAGAEVPLLDVNHLSTLYLANLNREDGWSPYADTNTKERAVSWDAWVETAFGTAWLMKEDGAELVPEPQFHQMYLLAVDGLMHGYQHATSATRYLPVSTDDLVARQLIDPDTNRMLVSISADENLLATDPFLFNATQANLEQLISGQRIYAPGRDGADPASAKGRQRARIERWHREAEAPRQSRERMRGVRAAGQTYLGHTTTTSAFWRSMINLRAGNALFNVALMVSAPIEAFQKRSINMFANVAAGESTGKLGRAHSRLTERFADTSIGAVAEALGVTATYTVDQQAQLGTLIDAISTRPEFKALVYKELMFQYPTMPGIGRVEKALEKYAKAGARLQDPTWGMLPKDLARIYVETVMRKIAADPLAEGVYSTERLLTELGRNPEWIKTNDPEAHSMAIAAIANVRSLKPTVLSLGLRGIIEPLSENPKFGRNSVANALKMLTLFQNFWSNSLINVTGLQGVADFAAFHLDGRKKSKLNRLMAAALRGETFVPEETEYYDMSEVIEGMDLADSFIRGGITHTALFTLGLFAGGLGLSGDDEEEKRRRRAAELQGAAYVRDPRKLQADYRNKGAIYLDWLPFGLDSFFKADPTNPDSPAMAQMNWTMRYFMSPIIGFERFYETGDFSEIIHGFSDAVGSHPIVNAQLWNETLETVAQLQESSDDAIEAGDHQQGAHLLITAVGVMERMMLENSMVNMIYVGTDRYDRDPYALPALDSDGNPQVDVRGNPYKTNGALKSYVDDQGTADPADDVVREGYVARDSAGATLRTFTENRFGLALVGSLFTGVTGGGFTDNDLWRQNMPIKVRKFELAPTDQGVIEADLLAAFHGANLNSAAAQGPVSMGLTVEEAAQVVKAKYEAAGVWWEADEVEKQAKLLSAQSQVAALSLVDEAGREHLTDAGARAIFDGLRAGTATLGDAALNGVYITQPQRDKIRDELAAELVQEGVDLGLNTEQATWRMRRIMFGSNTEAGTPKLIDLIYTKDLPWTDTLEYNQLNTTYVLGPDGRPQATGFTRDGLFGALGVKPLNRTWNAADTGLATDSRLNTVDNVAGVNLGLRALEARPESWEIPSIEEITKQAAEDIVKAIKDLDFSPSQPYMNKPGTGYGYGGYYGGGYRRYGGYGGYSGGGSTYFTRMYALPGGTSPYGNSIPFINTSNPIIRRADVRRERVWSERGRLKQWQ